MANNNGNGFMSSVVHGVAIGLGLSIALGAIKIFSNTTGFGKDFVILKSNAGTLNTLIPDSTGTTYHLR